MATQSKEARDLAVVRAFVNTGISTTGRGTGHPEALVAWLAATPAGEDATAARRRATAVRFRELCATSS